MASPGTNGGVGPLPVDPSTYENPVIDAFTNKQDLSQYTPEQLAALAQDIDQMGVDSGNQAKILDSLQTLQSLDQPLNLTDFLNMVEIDNPKLPPPQSLDPQQVYTDYKTWFESLTPADINDLGQDAYANAEYTAYILNTIAGATLPANSVAPIVGAVDTKANEYNASLVPGMLENGWETLGEVQDLFNQLDESNPNYIEIKDLIGTLEQMLTLAEATFSLSIQGNQQQISQKSQAQLDKQLDQVKKQQEQYEKQKKAAEKAHTMGLVMKILGPLLAVVAAVLAIVTGGAMMALVLAVTVVMVADMVVQQTTGKGILSRMMDGVNDLIMKIPGIPDSVKQSIAIAVKVLLVAAITAVAIAAGGNVALAVQVCMTLVMNSNIGKNCSGIAKDAGASDTTCAIVDAAVTGAICVAGVAVAIKSAGQAAEDITNAAQKVSTLDQLMDQFPTVKSAVDTLLKPFNLAGDQLAAAKAAILKQIQGGDLESFTTTLNTTIENPALRTGAIYGLTATQGVVQGGAAIGQGVTSIKQGDFAVQIANIEAEISEIQAFIKQLKALIQQLISGIQPQMDFKSSIDKLKDQIFSGTIQAQGSFPV